MLRTKYQVVSHLRGVKTQGFVLSSHTSKKDALESYKHLKERFEQDGTKVGLTELFYDDELEVK